MCAEAAGREERVAFSLLVPLAGTAGRVGLSGFQGIGVLPRDEGKRHGVGAAIDMSTLFSDER